MDDGKRGVYPHVESKEKMKKAKYIGKEKMDFLVKDNYFIYIILFYIHT